MTEERNSRYRYVKIPNNEITAMLRFFEGMIEKFLFYYKKFPKNFKYQVSGVDLIDIVFRVDKRKAYYLFFHDMKIDEFKTVALCAYWIIKLKPLTITDERFRDNREYADINECFAIFLIMGIMRVNDADRDFISKKPFFEQLRYSFRFRNFTIDSFVVLLESMNAEMFK